MKVASRRIALERAKIIALAIMDKLLLYCEKLEVVGSIRRQVSWVHDIDIVLIPKPEGMWNLHGEIARLSRPKTPKGGGKIVHFEVVDIPVDLYFADASTWATLLLIRTGPTENNIRLCSIAKKKGWHLAASGDGLFNERGERIAGSTEESIFTALGLQYLPPEKRT